MYERTYIGLEVPAGVTDTEEKFMQVAKRQRGALFALFFIPGLGFATWVGRTPALRDALEATTAQMGMILFGLSVGSILGVLIAPKLVPIFGTLPVIITGVTSVAISLCLMGLGAEMTSPALVTAGLFAFGVGMGGGEIALNVDGGILERTSGTPVLALLHGSFSLGALVGAVLSFLAAAGDVPVLAHLLIIVALISLTAIIALRHVPSGTGKFDRGKRRQQNSGKRGRIWTDPLLLMAGFIALTMALAEGTGSEWLPLIMVDGHGYQTEMGSLMYVVFTAAMVVGRFGGGLLVIRYGRVWVFVASVAIAAGGMACVSFIDSPLAAGIAVGFWGLGISLGFPLALSAAAEHGDNPAARVSAVATIGYIALLAGPPAIGLLGDQFGLRTAMLLPLSFVLLTFLMMRVMRPGPGQPSVRPRDEELGAQDQDQEVAFASSATRNHSGRRRTSSLK